MKIIALPTANPTSIPVFKIKGNKQFHTDKDGYHGNLAEIENYALYVVDDFKYYPKYNDYVYYEGDNHDPEGIYKYTPCCRIPILDKTYYIIATTDCSINLPDIRHDLVQAYCESPDIIINSMALNFQWEFPQAKSMIKAYRTYRCSHGINHSDLINISGMTIDQLDDFGNWWTISNNNEEIEFKLGEEMAYDTPHNAYKNYF